MRKLICPHCGKEIYFKPSEISKVENFHIRVNMFKDVNKQSNSKYNYIMLSFSKDLVLKMNWKKEDYLKLTKMEKGVYKITKLLIDLSNQNIKDRMSGLYKLHGRKFLSLKTGENRIHSFRIQIGAKFFYRYTFDSDVVDFKPFTIEEKDIIFEKDSIIISLTGALNANV